MWNERYSAKEYAYGTEPNTFLAANFAHLPKGRVLSLAEGEGRNAVFLAQQGYAVSPLPPAIRQALYRKVFAALKPGGVFLLEAYTPEQIKHGTGGGKSVELMQTEASLRAELPGLDFVHLLELEREVVEGTFHTGLGAVVQAIGVKRA